MEQANKYASFFVDDTLVSIELEDGGRFKVQKALLCDKSDYFRTALCGGFQEANSQKLSIPDCTTQSFELILYWIGHGKLPDLQLEVQNFENGPPSSNRNKLVHLQQVELSKLWLTSEMLLLGRLQNETMKCLLSVTQGWCISVNAMRVVFERASLDSPLRRVFVEQFTRDMCLAYEFYSSEYKDAFGGIPGFLQAIFKLTQPTTRLAEGGFKIGKESTPDSEFMVAHD